MFVDEFLRLLQIIGQLVRGGRSLCLDQPGQERVQVLVEKDLSQFRRLGTRKDFVLINDLFSFKDAFQTANWAKVFPWNLNIDQRNRNALILRLRLKIPKLLHCIQMHRSVMMVLQNGCQSHNNDNTNNKLLQYIKKKNYFLKAG